MKALRSQRRFAGNSSPADAGWAGTYGAGLRISELLALRVQDVARDRRVLVIKGKGGVNVWPLTAVSVEVVAVACAPDKQGP